jgi:RNA polymerase sigma factor (sigma-70 family)
VWRVCKRVLRNDQDVEDAFQATFLVLASKASVVCWQKSVANWLHGVAWRIAAKASSGSARRQEVERRAIMPTWEPRDEVAWQDLCAVLDEEVNYLPAKYRAPVVLCYLQGKTNEEAARELGCPKGTILSRLAWARARLRERLTRRGLNAAPVLGAVLAEQANAALPALPVAATVHAALLFKAGKTAAAPLVIDLADTTIRAMSVTRLKSAIVVLLALGIVAAAVTVAVPRLLPAEQPPLGASGTTGPAVLDAEPTKLPYMEVSGDPLPAGAIARLGDVRLRHMGSVRALAFSPDGRYLAATAAGIRTTSRQDRQACVWDAVTGRAIQRINGEFIGFAADSTSLAALEAGWEIVFRHVVTGKVVRRFPQRCGQYDGVILSPDGKTLVAYPVPIYSKAGKREPQHQMVRVWETASGKELAAFAQGASFYSAVFRDGGMLATLGQKKIEFWELATGKMRGDIRSERNSFDFFDLAFSPDGKMLAVQTYTDPKGDRVQVLDTATGKEIRRLARPAEGAIPGGVAFSPDGKAMVYGSEEIHLWDTTGEKEVRMLGKKSPSPIQTLAFSPDGRTVAAGDYSGSIRLWSAVTGAELAPSEKSREFKASRVAYSPDGRALAWGRRDGKNGLWEVATGKEICRFGEHIKVEQNSVVENLHYMVLAPDGKIMASAPYRAEGRPIYLWDVASGKEIRRFGKHDAAFLPDCLCPRRHAASFHDGRRGNGPGLSVGRRHGTATATLARPWESQ